MMEDRCARVAIWQRIRCFMSAGVIVGLLSIVGCGGGTSGTGGITVSGQTLDQNSRPLQGVYVVALDTGDATITDTDGRFIVVAARSVPNTTISFERGESRVPATIEGLPDDAESIEATFKIDFERRDSAVSDVQIKRRGRTNGEGLSPSPTPDLDDDDDDDRSSSSSTRGSSSSGDDDDDGEGSSSSSGDGQGEEIEVRGIISVISSTAIVVDGVVFVPTPRSRYKNANGQSTTILGIFVGQFCEAEGEVVDGVVYLEKLEVEDEKD